MCAIFLKHGQEFVEMVERPYQAESILQQLLADHPALLAGDGDSGDRNRWLLVKREMGLASEEDSGNRWSIDHLFLDQAGVPTLVEVKRASDTRIRREVVGQILDYAANASVFWGLAEIKAAFESRHDGPDDAQQSLEGFLGGDETPEGFWETVGVNLKAGKLRLVFVADEIPSELRRIVEFLNEQMGETEVLAVEVRQYVEQGQVEQAKDSRVTLVPRLIGETEAARRRKPRAHHKWGEDDVLRALQEQYPADVARRIVNLYEFLRDEGARRSWGKGAKPSVTMWLGEDSDAGRANPVCVGIFQEYLAVTLHYLRDRRTPEEMARLVDLLRQIPGAGSSFEGVEERDYSVLGGMPAEKVLASDEALEVFKRVILEAARRAEPDWATAPGRVEP